MASIRIGIGGWTYEPWRGTFYPAGLPQARELEYASRALTSIEINGPYYSRFSAASWEKWRAATPDGFVFAVKASRYATNRKNLAEAGPSIEQFLDQGLTRLGDKLGPINWQLAHTKRFDAGEIGAFLALLPAKRDGLALRHAIEARHESFATEAFFDLARARGIAVVRAVGGDYPDLDADTASFRYLRMMGSEDRWRDGFPPQRLKTTARQARALAASGDVYLYVISGAKERNPAAALALGKLVGGGR